MYHKGSDLQSFQLEHGFIEQRQAKMSCESRRIQKTVRFRNSGAGRRRERMPCGVVGVVGDRRRGGDTDRSVSSEIDQNQGLD